ncbi:putative ribosome biogenesis protein Bms1/Tsr1 [Helianthus debilis subsp. tardiflorus]
MWIWTICQQIPRESTTVKGKGPIAHENGGSKDDLEVNIMLERKPLFFNIMQVHGFPKVMGVLTHLDKFKDVKKLKKTKQRLKHRFWAEIYDGAKLFYLSGLIHGNLVCGLQVFGWSRFRFDP